MPHIVYSLSFVWRFSLSYVRSCLIRYPGQFIISLVWEYALVEAASVNKPEVNTYWVKTSCVTRNLELCNSVV
jgi:hypothetical protein